MSMDDHHARTHQIRERDLRDAFRLCHATDRPNGTEVQRLLGRLEFHLSLLRLEVAEDTALDPIAFKLASTMETAVQQLGRLLARSRPTAPSPTAH
jgi:hypothetical protein